MNSKIDFSKLKENLQKIVSNLKKIKKEEVKEEEPEKNDSKVFIKIEGKNYEVLEWSTIRCVIKAPNPQYFLNRRYAKAEMLFVFDDEIIKIDNLELEFIKIREDMGLVAKFNNLTQDQKEILNYIISNNIVKQIITPQKPAPKKLIKIDKKKLLKICAAIFGIGIVSGGAVFVYDRANLITTTGFVDKDLFLIKSPIDGYIYPHKKLKFYTNDKVATIYNIKKEKFIVLSPINGNVYKINVKNKEFVKKGEVIASIIPLNSENLIKAYIPLDADIKQGYIATIKTESGEIKAKVKEIEYEVDLTKHSFKDKKVIYLKPFKKVPLNEVFTITIDPLLNKFGFIKSDDEIELNINEATIPFEEENKTLIPLIIPTKTITNKSTQPQPKKIIQQQKKEPVKHIKVAKPVNKTTPKQIQKKPPTPKPAPIKKEIKQPQKTAVSQKKEVKAVKKDMFCIVVASVKERHPKQEKLFHMRYPKTGFIVKEGNLYVLKIGKFSSRDKAERFKKIYVDKFYKDAFIIKCKPKK